MLKGQVNYSVVYDDERQKVPVKIWDKHVPMEDKVYEQLKKIASLPFIHKHVSAMSDAHVGKGSCVGAVIPTISAIIPATCGVDLGCGIIAVQTDLKASDLPENLKKMRTAIEKAIPHGRDNHGGRRDKGAWGEPPNEVVSIWRRELEDNFKKICEKHPKIEKSNNVNHLCSLGSGNHMLCINIDEEQHIWFMLHSGSRGVGNVIGTYFIEKAKQEMRKWYINLPDQDLSYLPEGSKYFDDYIEAMFWAQDFALWNRKLMMKRMIDAVSRSLSGKKINAEIQAVNCHHNYVARENHFGRNVFITRKGAIRAREGDMGVIPGCMGGKSYIVCGKGNPESFHSCSHGAGRLMSRTQAKHKFTLDDHIKALKGVEARLDEDILDETPGAYKNIEDVMRSQKDLVEVVHILQEILNVKG